MKRIQLVLLSILLLLTVPQCSGDKHEHFIAPELIDSPAITDTVTEREIKLPSAKPEDWKPVATIMGADSRGHSIVIPQRGNSMDPYNISYDSRGNPKSEMKHIFLNKVETK